MTLEERFLGVAGGAGYGNEPDGPPTRDLEYAALEMLATHGKREGAAIAAYERVAAESKAGDAIQYLIRMILEDERRHHQVFEEMVNELRSFVWEVEIEPKVPSVVDRADPALLAETKALLEIEKDDAKELRKLRKLVRRGPSSSLHPVLVEWMLHDTAKHIAILEFIRDHLRRE
jgi:hypothetical protein